MNDSKTNTKRRTLLKGFASVPVVALIGHHGIATAEMLSPSDPLAVQLKYVENSADPAKSCANCMLYQGGDAATGGCPIFPGKAVAATGYCSSWTPKPA